MCVFSKKVINMTKVNTKKCAFCRERAGIFLSDFLKFEFYFILLSFYKKHYGFFESCRKY